MNEEEYYSNELLEPSFLNHSLSGLLKATTHDNKNNNDFPFSDPPARRYPNNSSANRNKPVSQNRPVHGDDLITFDEKLVQIEDNASILTKYEFKMKTNPKCYDEIKSLFDNPLSNPVADDNLSCFESIELGKVIPLKSNKNSVTEKITSGNNENEVIPLGRLILTKPFVESTTLEGISKSSKISPNLVDLFEDVSVTPKDIMPGAMKYNTMSENYTNKQTFMEYKSNSKSETVKGLCRSNNPESDSCCKLETSMVHKVTNDNIIAVKDDKILTVLGNNVTIKCDRTFIISAEPHGVCSSCNHNNKLITKNSKMPNFCQKNISNTSEPETSETSKKIPSVHHMSNDNATPVYNQEVTYLSNFSQCKNIMPESMIHRVDNEKLEESNEMIAMKSTGEQLTEAEREKSNILLKGLQNNILPRLEPEILANDHAKRRLMWQKQRVAIDHFINGKVIK